MYVHGIVNVFLPKLKYNFTKQFLKIDIFFINTKKYFISFEKSQLNTSNLDVPLYKI